MGKQVLATLTFYNNLDKIPFSAYERIVSNFYSYLKPFYREGMEKDLTKGLAGPLIYYFHEYIDKLYEIAMEKKEWRDFLSQFCLENVIYFEEIFSETKEKLDTIKEKNIKRNHLSEVCVSKGKVKK